MPIMFLWPSVTGRRRISSISIYMDRRLDFIFGRAQHTTSEVIYALGGEFAQIIPVREGPTGNIAIGDDADEVTVRLDR